MIIESELADSTDADATPEDEDELKLELKAVPEADEEPEAVAKTASARRLPWVEMLELYIDSMLEELEMGRLDNEEEPERILLDDIDVELPMSLEDDAEAERTLLDELDEVMLDDDLLLLVDETRVRLDDGVGEVDDRIFGVELDRDEVDDGETEELLVVLLLLILVELLLVLTELLLFLLDVLVVLLVLILVSDALNELDVVDVTFLVTFLRSVNLFALHSTAHNSTYAVEVTVLETVAVTTCFEGVGALMVLFTVFVEIFRRDWQ